MQKENPRLFTVPYVAHKGEKVALLCHTAVAQVFENSTSTKEAILLRKIA